MARAARKVKVTLSISSSVLKTLDQRRGRKTSRSAAVEADIEDGNRAARQRALDEEIIAYYSVPPTEEEKELSKFLHRAAAQAMARSEAADDDFSGWEQPKRKRK
jgi:metal-responsive CopG/Arc/MetJ family transcriptional regulator